MDSTTSTQPAPEATYLGTIGALSCEVATTHEPWRLDIDAIVVSVGSGMGRLARSVKEQFPQAPWETASLREITPARPRLLPLTMTDSGDSRVPRIRRFSYVLSAHGGSELTGVHAAEAEEE